jgi:hypothetical protein
VAVVRGEAHRFSGFSRASRRGFTFTGPGRATVRTPRFFQPGHRYLGGVGTTTRHLRADDHGRLTVVVPAGATRPTRVSISR